MKQIATMDPSEGIFLINALLRSEKVSNEGRERLRALKAELEKIDATKAADFFTGFLEEEGVSEFIVTSLERYANRRREEEERRAVLTRELVPLDSPTVPSHIDEYPCDKCGRLVPAHNSAVRFADFLSRVPATADYEGVLFFGSHNAPLNRHLFPIVEGGAVVCEGSPSRAKYLPGGQPDLQLNIGVYKKALEVPFRVAFAAFRRQFPERTTT